MHLILQRARRLASALTFLLTLLAAQPLAADDAQQGEQSSRRGLELFEKKIRPALVEHCYECHAPDSDDLGGNLLVDTRAGLLVGGDSGAAVVAGKPDASLLLQAIEYDGIEMPPDQKLPETIAADFRRWISLGAPDPRTQKPNEAGEPSPELTEPIEMWSVKPIRSVAPPRSDSAWPETEIDRFIFRKLASHDVKPNPDAAPEVLLRRVYFDLIGLPPSPEDIRRFTSDPSPQHYAEIVDSLLASSAFGERWGRHWLDVARYGESAGSSRDVLMLYAWRYRDYVIDAMNADLPFDRFITEQIAGDLLDAETEEERKRLRIATGLLAIGSKSLNGGNLTYDIIDDQIDVIAKSMLGLTVSCARCHDHKFDPIPTADYYSLAGIFLSTETRYGGSIKRPEDARSREAVYLSLATPPDPDIDAQRAKVEQEFRTLSKQINSSKKRVASLIESVPQEYRSDPDKAVSEELGTETRQEIRQYQGSLRVLRERRASLKEVEAKREKFPEPQYALGVQEAKKIRDANILVRGEKDQQGPVSPRGFLSSVDTFHDGNDLSIDEHESGRRQLARWLTHPDHPLTSRVAVNRIWHHLMGQGIVPTVDNFGISGSPPTHPELLDHLAGRFVTRYGWSQKRLIREIVLSRTYRLSSAPRAEASDRDPDNRLRWKMDRRRLEAEPLRDAMLSVSGLLRHQPLAGSLVMRIGEGEVGRNIDTSVLEKPFDHRSVYLPIIRGIIPEELKLFDFPEPSNVQGRRDSNTTAKQSLFFMNSPSVVRAAEHFAADLLDSGSDRTRRQRIELAYLRCFGRPPTEGQIDRSVNFIEEMADDQKGGEAERGAWTTFCQSLIASAPFRFID